MKELESMDDDRLVKFMQIVKMMDELNKLEEEKNKAEDIAVTEQSEQLNAAFNTSIASPTTPSSTVGSDVPQPLNQGV